ncbi:MAG: type IV pilus assembly protein PilM [Kiritimatiellae bacterium]|nr:type IV pilus assembly protein PilM [Kiritimatiellia bacterium]
MAKEPILTLDIGAYNLKLAEFVETRGGLEMTRYAVTDLGLDPQSEEDRSQYIIQAIHSLIDESGCKPGPVQISISGHSIFSKFVKLTPTTPDKVTELIRYEAQQNIPFPLNEVVWDYQIVTGKDGDAEVMLVAIKSEDIAKICDCVTFAGLKPEMVDVAPMALYNAVRYNYDNLPECTLLVDIGARSTDLIFLEAGRIFSRSVPVAGNQISQAIQQEFEVSYDDAEALKKAHAYVGFGGPYEAPQSETTDKVSKAVRAMMTRLHLELNRSINFYRGQQGGKTPSLILLTGGSSVIPYADSFLREKLRLDVDYFNPFNNVAVSEAIPTDQIAAHACELGPLVGLALRKCRTCPVALNLIPSVYEEEKKFKQKLPYFAISAATLLITLGLWIAGYRTVAASTQTAQEKVDSRVHQLKADEASLAETETEVAQLKAQVERLAVIEDGRGAWREMLAEITSRLPDGVWLSQVAPLNPERTIVVEEEDDRAARRRQREAPKTEAPPDPSNPRALLGISVTGIGYTDVAKNPDATIKAFRDALRESPLFSSDKTEIAWQQLGMPGAPTFTFSIRVPLAHDEPQPVAARDAAAASTEES